MPLQNCTKCSALIPDDLLEKLKEAGYENRAEAIRLGLECLLRESRENIQESVRNQMESLTESCKNQGESYKNLEESYKNLKESYEKQKESYEKQKESYENIRESVAEFKARNDELEKHNMTLKDELEKAGQREEDLKSMYNNYMLQIQTLIKQKAIEAPGEKKKWWKFW